MAATTNESGEDVYLDKEDLEEALPEARLHPTRDHVWGQAIILSRKKS